MSDDIQVNQVLVAILEMLRDLHLYSERQHHWIVALRYAIPPSRTDLDAQLKDHPWFDLGPAPSLRNLDAITQRIDELIRQLKG